MKETEGMKRSRFTEDQIIGIFKEQESGIPTADVCRRHGISSATFSKYKSKLGGMEVSDSRKLKALEDENAKLETLSAQTMLDVAIFKDVASRRACSVLSVDRSSMRYRSIRPDDAHIREAMKTVVSERRRFGYRRIHVMLERQGLVMNLKKLRRLYREEKLTVCKRGGRKGALGSRRPLVLPSRPNEPWSLDFVSDAFTDGRRFRILTVVDDFMRECLALLADTQLSGHRLSTESNGTTSRRESRCRTALWKALTVSSATSV
jgi:putative transposase